LRTIEIPRGPERSPNLVFRGERLQLVREFRGYTQKELADLVKTSSAAVSDFENGKRLPSEQLIDLLSTRTGFLPSFFFERIAEPFSESQCSFRHRRTTPQRSKDQVRAHASLVGMVVGRLREIFRFPDVEVPSNTAMTPAEIEKAAEGCRAAWKLDLNAPIKQVVRALERAGIVVISGSVDVSKIDAFSRFGTNPLIFLNRAVGTFPSRWNFDLAHELGHLVLHRDLVTGSVESEAAADLFAAAFLMPSLTFGSEFRSRRFSWSLVFELKRRWQVSAAAIVRRGRDLGLIEEVTYRRAFQYMSAKRWRIFGEPHEPLFQEPELFSEGLRAIKENSEDGLAGFAHSLGLSAGVFQEVAGIEENPASLGRLLPFNQTI
jgi:Zn-dependent peptidase ImmA (M78 family)/transcriptional regulator with XRE-family HTH domain